MNSWLKHWTTVGVLTAFISACGFVDEGVDKSEPPIVGDDNYTVAEGAELDVDAASGVLANDVDAGGQALTAELVSGPDHATVFQFNADGSFIYEHNGNEPPPPNGQDTFSYIADDGVKKSDPKQVVINITPVNDAPVITGLVTDPDPFNSPEDNVINVVNAVVVSDPDNAYPGDFTAIIEPGANFTVSGSTITPLQDYSGPLSVSAKVSDGQAESNSFDFTVMVEPVNDAPVIQGQTTVTTPEDIGRVISLADLTVDDVDNPPADLQLTMLTPPANANYVLNGNTVEPLPNFNGDLTVPLMVSDGTDNSNQFDLTVTVNAVNDTPIFGSTEITTATEDLGYTYAVATSDPDVGDVLTITAPTLPGWLALTPAGNGLATLSGTPTNDNVGPNNVVLRVTDAGGQQQTQAFTIMVANVNDAPTFASTPVLTGTQDTPYAYNVVVNDVDFGDTVTISGTLPAWLTLTPTGPFTATLSGTPRAANVGNNSVSLTVTDAVGATATQDFAINVIDVNDPPVFVSSPITTATQGVAYSYDANANDPDAGDVLTYSLTTAPVGMTINPATGVVSWTPTNAQVGSNVVTITVTDDDPVTPLSATQSFTIVVADVNDPPVIVSAAVTTATQGVPYAYDVNATDADVGDVLTYSLTVAPAGMTINPANGLIAWTPAASQIGVNNVTVTVTDNAATPLSGTQVFTINVTNVNDPPTIVSTAITSATQGVQYTYDVNATDPDAGDVLTYSLSVAPTGMVINATTGVITWTPTNAQVGNNAVTVVVTDSGTATDTQSFSVAVANVNDPPAIVSTAVTTATQDVPYTYDVNATDPDVGDVLTYSLQAPIVVGMTINPTTGVISWTPNNAQIGNNNVTVVVTDTGSANATQSFVIIVSDANDAPVINSTAVTTATQDTPYTYDVNATDPDAGDVLTYSLTVAPVGMAINATTGVITWTPAANQVGPQNVTVTVTDNGVPPLSVSQPFIIDVADVNEPPTIISSAVTTAAETLAYSYGVNATDPDPGEVLTYSLSVAPAGMTINASSGLISWTPSVGQGGTHPVTVVVSDDEAVPETDTQSFNITVNRQPVLINVPAAPESANETTPYSYDIDATDGDVGDTLTYSVSAVPTATGMAINTATGLIAWTPQLGQAGSYTVTVTVTDNGTPAVSASGTFTLTVTELGFGMTATEPEASQTAEAEAPSPSVCLTTPQEQPLIALLPDEPTLVAPLTFSLVTNAVNGDVTIEPTGQFTYTPLVGGIRGRDTFDYLVEDATGITAVKTATVITDLKVMPLGDSVTTGITDATDPLNLLPSVELRAGYRQPLYEAVIEAGYGIDFVGSQQHGTGLTPAFDVDHEGHEGWSALELGLGSTVDPSSGIYYWLDQNPTDIVLLQVGTDVPETSVDSIVAILDAIDRWEDDTNTLVTVLIGLIIDETPPNPEIVALNNAIQSMVDERFAIGDDILAVDLQSALLGFDGLPDTTLYGDALRPNAAGYQLMADTWFGPLTGVLEKCP